MNTTSYLAAITVVLIWGFNMLAIRVAVTEVPPLMMTTLRFALVSLILLPFAPIPRGRIKDIALLSLTFGTGHFAMLFLGLSMVEVGPSAIVLQLGVPFSSLLAAVFFQDHLGLKRSLGMILSFGGVTLLFWDPSMTELRSPLLIVMLSAFMWAVANIQIKRIGAIGFAKLNGWMAIFATPQLLIFSLIFEDAPFSTFLSASWLAWECLLFTAIGSSLIAYGLWQHLLRSHDINQVAPLMLAGPVVGVLASVLLLGEQLTLLKLIGGVIALIGVGIIVIRRAHKTAPKAESL